MNFDAILLAIWYVQHYTRLDRSNRFEAISVAALRFSFWLLHNHHNEFDTLEFAMIVSNIAYLLFDLSIWDQTYFKLLFATCWLLYSLFILFDYKQDLLWVTIPIDVYILNTQLPGVHMSVPFSSWLSIQPLRTFAEKRDLFNWLPFRCEFYFPY